MRGIPEDKAVEIGEQIDSCKYLECSVKEWLRDECQELQEPWIPIDEFLKSGFEGECWIIYCGDVEKAYFFINSFYKRVDSAWSFHKKQITHVMPIRKPELPK